MSRKLLLTVIIIITLIAGGVGWYLLHQKADQFIITLSPESETYSNGDLVIIKIDSTNKGLKLNQGDLKLEFTDNLEFQDSQPASNTQITVDSNIIKISVNEEKINQANATLGTVTFKTTDSGVATLNLKSSNITTQEDQQISPLFLGGRYGISTILPPPEDSDL